MEVVVLLTLLAVVFVAAAPSELLRIGLVGLWFLGLLAVLLALGRGLFGFSG